jgi:hypothetical protein
MLARTFGWELPGLGVALGLTMLVDYFVVPPVSELSFDYQAIGVFAFAFVAARMTQGARLKLGRMSADKHVRTVDELLLVLGGPDRVAELLNVENHDECMWLRTGRVPCGWHLRLYLAAKQLGYTVDARLFNGPRRLRKPSRSG